LKKIILMSLFFIGFAVGAGEVVSVKITPHGDVGYARMEISQMGQVSLFEPTYKGYKLSDIMTETRTQKAYCQLLGLSYVISDTGYTTEFINNTSEETKIDVVVLNDTNYFRFRKSNQFIDRVVCQ